MELIAIRGEDVNQDLHQEVQRLDARVRDLEAQVERQASVIRSLKATHADLQEVVHLVARRDDPATARQAAMGRH